LKFEEDVRRTQPKHPWPPHEGEADGRDMDALLEEVIAKARYHGKGRARVMRRLLAMIVRSDEERSWQEQKMGSLGTPGE